MLAEQQLVGDSTLSEYLKSFYGIFHYYFYLPERFMMDFAQTLREILDAHSGLRAVVMRPLNRSGPAAYKGDLSVIQVC